jgi:hypothetical protein
MKTLKLLPFLVLALLVFKWIEKKPTQSKVSSIMKSQNMKENAGQRTIASIPTKPRKIIGADQSKNISDLTFENSISSSWKDDLKKNLEELGNNEVTVTEIEHHDSYIQVRQGKARYLESVIVRMKNVTGMPSSFRAEIDSQNGQVLKTWDKPIFENFKDPHQKEAKIIVDEKDYFKPL